MFQSYALNVCFGPQLSVPSSRYFKPPLLLGEEAKPGGGGGGGGGWGEI